MVKTKPNTVGLTKDAGWQIGVRQTLDVAPQAAWEALTSPEGLRLWLGEIDWLPARKGERYLTANGTSGELRANNPGEHVRLTWQPKGWQNPSILQVRVTPSGRKTTVSFHQERLESRAQREQMRAHWQEVIQQVAAMLG